MKTYKNKLMESKESELLKKIKNLEWEKNGTVDIQISIIESFFDVTPEFFKKIAKKNGYKIKEDEYNDSWILSKK